MHTTVLNTYGLTYKLYNRPLYKYVYEGPYVIPNFTAPFKKLLSQRPSSRWADSHTIDHLFCLLPFSPWKFQGRSHLLKLIIGLNSDRNSAHMTMIRKTQMTSECVRNLSTNFETFGITCSFLWIGEILDTNNNIVILWIC